jgi:hypothetical protein
MRIRIRQARRGEVDGISLEKFQVGAIYDVPPSLATYLITTGCAECDVNEAGVGVAPLRAAATSSSGD